MSISTESPRKPITQPVKKAAVRRRLDFEAAVNEAKRELNRTYYQNGNSWKMPTKYVKGNATGRKGGRTVRGGRRRIPVASS